MKNTCLLLPILALVLFSCNKDKSVTDLLTSGSWKLADLSSEYPDYYSLDDCDKDDLIIFKSGDVVTYDGGDCSSTPRTENGTWQLSADEKVITLDKGAIYTSISYSDEADWEIITLNKKSLVIKYWEDNQGGAHSSEITLTFSR